MTRKNDQVPILFYPAFLSDRPNLSPEMKVRREEREARAKTKELGALRQFGGTPAINDNDKSKRSDNEDGCTTIAH